MSGETTGQVLMKADEVAALFQVSESMVRTYCRRGVIPYVRVGRSYRFTREHVAEAVEALTVPRTAQSVTAAQDRARDEWGLATKRKRRAS